jgi:hypothetical protein|tara:strand:- start:78 stop:842 length:765 start_codon:yes stop_codon:yes gene_type:complete
MFSTFYNESIRKLVIGFGSLFNNINVRKFDSSDNVLQTIRVPISYAPKEKFVARLNEGGSIIEDDTKVKAILPRIGFDITGINYDPTRTINKLRKGRKNSASGNTADTMFHEVPYNVSFGMYAFTSSIDENLQIIEQILPFFTPEFIVSLNMNSIHTKVDIPVTLSNVNIQEDYEGNFFARRFVSSSFEFLAKSYVYGPTKVQTVIEGITAEFRTDLTGTGGGDSGLLESFGITGSIVTGLSGPLYTPAQGRSL